MRIAVVSTVYHQTPPTGYGGIERVVHIFVEALVRRGHDVTLFARPGSSCSGRTVEVGEYANAPMPSGHTSRASILSEEPLYQAMVAELAHRPVDLVHDWSFQNLFITRHLDRLPFIISTCIPLPEGFRRPNLVASSAAHAQAVGGGIPFVHYGLDLSQWRFTKTKTAPVAHIAKVARYKGQHDAILASIRTKQPLELYGNIEDPHYFNWVVRPLILASRGTVSFRGELQGTASTLGAARALVQTPRWFDAFPLVILESLACGTPVVSYAKGGTPEQIVDGVTGFLVDDRSGLAEALARLDELAPEACRDDAESRFSVERMVQQYEHLYERARAGDGW